MCMTRNSIGQRGSWEVDQVFRAIYCSANLFCVSTIISRRRKGKIMRWKEVVAMRTRHAMLHSSRACGGGSGHVQRHSVMGSLMPLARVHGSAVREGDVLPVQKRQLVARQMK
jgi:hypothetical protein